jgi:ABC-2 type transport system ATP-binding protein
VEWAIQCSKVCKCYGKVHAVCDLDLTVRNGECFGLLGPNGAGKTTTIEILEGLLNATSGEVLIFGRTWKENHRELRELVGVVLQDTQLSEKLTVRETVKMFGSFYDDPLPTDQVLQLMSLNECADIWMGRLSGGQRQRVAIATALIGNPKILFLDEPTRGLDPQSRRSLWQAIGTFQENGGTILLSTHYMDEAERLCNRIAIIDNGRVIAQGSPADLILRQGTESVVEFSIIGNLDAQDFYDWESLPGVESVRRRDHVIILGVHEPHQTVPALLDRVRELGHQLSYLNTRHASLEDVFVALSGRSLRE